MDRTLLAELADRVLSGAATEQEVALLHQWYDKADKEEIELVFTPQRETEEDIRQRIFSGLQQAIEQTPEAQPRRIGRYVRWLAAASVLFILCLTGRYFWNTSNVRKEAYVAQPVIKSRKDLLPGTNKATLLLGDGSIVDLGKVQNGLIKNATGTRIDKRDGQLVYDVPASMTIAPEMNTIQTPRGGQYQLTLPDGTKVWLNAASTLNYPTAFVGKDRQVQLKGEAYFEVAEDKNKPFTVLVGDMQVNVLGTHFNVMAYDDENAIKTTLLQGAVKVTLGQTSHLLAVGQEASCERSSGNFRMLDVDADEAVAWKNGYFQFNGVAIETVMRQIARWYDVDVQYQGKTNEHFRGKIPRSVNASEVFKMLELTGAAHFTLEGKKIIVNP